MRGSIISMLGHLFEVHKCQHGKAPTMVCISSEYHGRLVREVDDIREVFGQKRTGQANRYRGCAVVQHSGTDILKVE